jgi:hypothetical protein
MNQSLKFPKEIQRYNVLEDTAILEIILDDNVFSKCKEFFNSTN